MLLLPLHLGQVCSLYLISIHYAGTLENEKKGVVESKLLKNFRMLRNKQERKEIKQKIAGYPHEEKISRLLFFLPFL